MVGKKRKKGRSRSDDRSNKRGKAGSDRGKGGLESWPRGMTFKWRFCKFGAEDWGSRAGGEDFTARRVVGREPFP